MHHGHPPFPILNVHREFVRLGAVPDITSPSPTERRNNRIPLNDAHAEHIIPILPFRYQLSLSPINTAADMSISHDQYEIPVSGPSFRVQMSLWKKDSSIPRFGQGKSGLFFAEFLAGSFKPTATGVCYDSNDCGAAQGPALTG